MAGADQRSARGCALCGRLVAFAFALAVAVGFGAGVGVRPAAAQFDVGNPHHGSAFRRCRKVPDRHLDSSAQRRSERADARARGRTAIRQRQQPHHRGRQRPDLLQALHARGRPGHLRAEDQAHARRGQRALHRSRRQGRARRDHRSDRSVPRRVRRFASARGRRQDALRGAARRAHGRPLHVVPERRLYGVRAVQGRSEQAAALADPHDAHHPRRNREDDLFRGRAPRIRSASRCSTGRIFRRPTRRSSARPACSIRSFRLHQHPGLRRRRSPISGRWRRTTTSR